jgi:hypothetical protein
VNDVSGKRSRSGRLTRFGVQGCGFEFFGECGKVNIELTLGRFSGRKAAFFTGSVPTIFNILREIPPIFLYDDLKSKIETLNSCFIRFLSTGNYSLNSNGADDCMYSINLCTKYTE